MKEIIKEIEKLKVICEEVKDNENVDAIIEEMKEILIAYHGQGLAANQIGYNKRIFLLMSDFDTNKIAVFINPIIESSDGSIITEEGCLSFPGKRINTKRNYEIFIKDKLFPQGRVCYGILGVAAQHELDHLNGITMFDREYKFYKIGRNDMCPCGSKKKYKKCCIDKEEIK
jgi:peptide deformylase